jgi:hypothetical protein
MCLAETTTPAPQNEDLNRLPSFALFFSRMRVYVLCCAVRVCGCMRVLCVHACVYVCVLCVHGCVYVWVCVACVCVACVFFF